MAVTLQVGVAGAGLLGRLVAWRLARKGHRVSVFDPAAGPEPTFDGAGAAAFTAAGLLSPLAERDVASDRVAHLGWRSIMLWRGIVQALPRAPHFSERGSLLVVHRGDLATAQRTLARLPAPGSGPNAPVVLTGDKLAAVEPALRGVSHAWLLPGEAQIDTVQAMRALHDDASSVHWHWGERVIGASPGELRLGDGSRRCFDLVFDLRGLGARPELPLRGVRGETVWLRCPGHGLTRPLRLVHPRHRIYMAPRPGDTLVIGASEVESEDRSEVSLKSAVELMSAAQSVMPILQEARILRLDRNLRPALPDHEPHLDTQPGLTRINGLFRHGWLVAPALVDDALRSVELA
ncbi:FAD-dependent oxidoreductase [Ideonella sp. DXS29W]|uniref:FAD-dependent oxidoreductase n=1 Tax=Ideonella lacteola TaxID=2984193 RepID=A0ABU9BIR5_9BURK